MKPKKPTIMAHYKSQDERPLGDFYATPRSLLWVASTLLATEFDKTLPILDPCAGEGAISDELAKLGYTVHTNDLYFGGVDYLTNSWTEQQVIMNPPFSLWDEFVWQAKTHARKILAIGKLSYLATQGRLKNNTWQHLKCIYCFNRCVDFQTPMRTDGCFYNGGIATGWFLWDDTYTAKPTLDILDVQAYATLGKFIVAQARLQAQVNQINLLTHERSNCESRS